MTPVSGIPIGEQVIEANNTRRFSLDASINKETHITERVQVQFGLEAFNVFNHNYFGRNKNFNPDPDNPNFGTLFPPQASTQNG